MKKPNIVFAFADQMRAQATGYAGDPNAHTPVLDQLASQSVNFVNAISGHPVCCPYRASFITGQYPQRHGIYINDVPLENEAVSIAEVFAQGGYDTGYIGKWHVYGSPDGEYGRRSAYIPRESRQGFEYWKAFECNHNYMKSPYFEGDDPEPKLWDGYDAIAQTKDACNYIRDHANAEKPFFLALSWGTPHDPYHLVPAEYLSMFRKRDIQLRPNVTDDYREKAVDTLRGYYAHIAALDDCVKMLMDAMSESGIADDTIFIFTSDHGDMHGSQGLWAKHNPWDESIRVPFLMRYPGKFGDSGSQTPLLIDAPDIMPTLLGICDLPVPETVQGRDFSPQLLSEAEVDLEMSAFLSVPVSYGILRAQGLPEYRGVRTVRYTYVRHISAPWLLYDNEADPYQMQNLCNNPQFSDLQMELESMLQSWLEGIDDEFLPGDVYLQRDNLTHYREAKNEWGRVKTPWTMPQRDIPEMGERRDQ